MTLLDLLEKARRISRRPYEHLLSRPAVGRGYLGYNCLFVPEETMHAAGYAPVRMFGKCCGADVSEKYVPSQCCDPVKNLLSSLDQGVFGFLDGAVFGYCCDTLQVASSILKERNPLEVFQVNVPTRFDGELALDYLAEEIRRFGEDLQARLGARIDRQDLEKSVDVYRENRELLMRLKRLRKARPQALSASDFLAVSQMGCFVPKEEHNGFLREILEKLAEEREVSEGSAPREAGRVMISGFLDGDLELLRRMEELGVTIVDDDLCEGSRGYEGVLPATEGEGPARRIARRILSLYCPVKSLGEEEYAKRLIAKYRESDAQGIVFLLFRFCDPQYMEYASAKLALREEGIPFVVLEPVTRDGRFAQMETRLEAFLESL